MNNWLKDLFGRKQENYGDVSAEQQMWIRTAVILESQYQNIADDGQSFASRAKRCAMGDLTSMMWMYREHGKRLEHEYRELETIYLNEPSQENVIKIQSYFSNHKEAVIPLLASHMWLIRAALYGLGEAKELVENNSYYKTNSFFNYHFQMPGDEQHLERGGTDLKKIGLLDFEEALLYEMYSLNEQGIYVARCYVGYEGPDETGFGMEDLYDYYFYDEFFCLLFILRGWSARDVRTSQDRIQFMCEKLKEKKQKEREEYWLNHRGDDMEQYRILYGKKR